MLALTTMLALFDPAADKTLETISVTIGGLLAAVYYGKEIFFPRQNPAVLDVRFVETLATKTDLANSVTKLELEDKVLHKRITDGRNDLDKTLRELPMQIVALLKNTGNLRQ